MAEARRRGPVDLLVGGLLVLGIGLVLARALVFDLRRIDNDGMAPALSEGQLVLVGRLAEAAPGDVVLVSLGSDAERYVKRVVAVEDEVVELTGGVLRVDGEPLATGPSRPHAACLGGAPAEVEAVPEARGEARWLAVPGEGDDVPATRLGPDEVYVVGDHRGRSRDSRTWGPLLRAEVHGVVLATLGAPAGCPPAASDGTE